MSSIFIGGGGGGGGPVEGTAVLSTGEVGGTKFLREDGDGTCSWQTVTGGSGSSSGPNYAIQTSDGASGFVGSGDFIRGDDGKIHNLTLDSVGIVTDDGARNIINAELIGGSIDLEAGCDNNLISLKMDNSTIVTSGTYFSKSNTILGSMVNSYIDLKASVGNIINVDQRAYGTVNCGYYSNGNLISAYVSGGTVDIKSSFGSLIGGIASSSGEIYTNSASGCLVLGQATQLGSKLKVATGIGSMVLGHCEYGGKVEVNAGYGCIAFGKTNSSGYITGGGNGSLTGGFAYESGNISNGNTALVFGVSTYQGLIQGAADGAVAIGRCTEQYSSISSTGIGAISLGSAEGGGYIKSEGIGSLAFGRVDDGRVHPTGNGSLAFGEVTDNASVEASNSSAMAFGRAAGSGTAINAGGIGSLAGGAAVYTGATITASGSGSIAFGRTDIAAYEITANSYGSMALGHADTGDIIAGATSCIQLGVGSNGQPTSFQCGLTGYGIRINGLDPASSAQVGDIFVRGGYVYIHSNSVDVKIV